MNKTKHIRKNLNLLLSLAVIVFSSFILLNKNKKPVLYIIGDSTVKNGDGTGKNNQMGWGTMIDAYFDTTKLSVRNHAIGGRSSRTFITEGRWTTILNTLKKGDFVIMQFGHNDASPLDDTARARGTIKGVGDDSTEIYNPIRKIREVVHSFGWYMRKYIRETKEKGATPIVCSLVPRNNWKDGKVGRSSDSWALWARQAAEKEGALFINLGDLISDQYDAMGADKVKQFFQADNTHTNKDGAILNAQMVIKGIENLGGCKLKKYIKKP